MRLIAVLLTVLLSSPALATKVSWDVVPCPLDGTASKVYQMHTQNTYGGFDSDLCSYSTQGQFRAYAIATCPEDLFTLYGEDFAQVPEETLLLALQAEAKEVQVDHPDPDALEVWDRYAIAARFYRVMGKDHLFMGELFHQASWVVRDEIVDVYAGLEGPVAAYALLEQGAIELQKDLSPEDRSKVLYNLARVSHRAGENEQRDRYLEQLAALPGLGDAERASIARMGQLATEVEPRFQDLALEEYLAALRQPDLPRADLVHVTYLAADLLRRRGRVREAVPLYSLVATAEDAPQQLRELALFLATRLMEGIEGEDAGQPSDD